jgi:peptide deformylase
MKLNLCGHIECGHLNWRKNMIREFLSAESPVLRQVAKEVTDFSGTSLRELAHDMLDTMRAGQGVGLAAPQIGVSLRVIVLEFQESDRAPGEPSIPATVLINPVILSGSGSVDGREGCFSIPGFMGIVTRHDEISYLAQDMNGRRTKHTAKGFHARIIQHEVDHLDGILYTDIAKKVIPWHRDVG